MGRPSLTLVALLCAVLLVLLGYLTPRAHAQADPKTKIGFSDPQFLKIGQAPEATFTLSATRTVSQKDLMCLARNIYHEARGESLLGMVGIAQITLNRADSQHRGKATLCGVVNDPSQFSWAGNKAPRKLDKKSWQQSLHVAQLVLLGVRITGMDNALYFHSRKIKQPKWSRELPVNRIIGSHIYFGDVNG